MAKSKTTGNRKTAKDASKRKTSSDDTASSRKSSGSRARSSKSAAAPETAPQRPTAIAASSLETYRELERTLYAVRDAVEAADSFEDMLSELERRGLSEDRVARVCDLSINGDLHVHSTASDGRIPPRKLPWLARVMGLEAVGLTDHDSVEGCREAFREGMLIGTRVVPGVELSTDTSGMELLVYFPDAGKLFNYLYSTKAVRFRKALSRRQDAVHASSLALLEHVNKWLKRRKVPEERLITLEEYDRWYGGQKPYFPGTLCVLGLARLSREQRDAEKIHDPRAFNTKVATPFLKRYASMADTSGQRDRMEENLALLRSLNRAGVPLVTVLAHPKELVTKGKKSLGAVRRIVFEMAEQWGLDGIEVACSRDTEDDVRYWRQIVAEYNATVSTERGSRRTKLLLEASHASDFHVLGPGRATGEITLGFGLLDERPAFRRGNLRPQMPLPRLLEQFSLRGRENAGLS